MATNYNYSKIAKLVSRVRQKDSQAFADIYSITYQKTYYFALMLLKNEESAQDAVQDIYLKALTSIDQLRDDKLFISWLNRIAYSTCMDILTANSRYIPSNDEFFEQIEDSDDLSDPLLRTVSNDTQRRLIRHIEALSPRLRGVILLKYYNGLKISEIASALNINEGTVKSRLNMAKQKLKDSISQSEETDYMFAYLPIVKALETSAMGVNLASDTALDLLTNTLAKCNLRTKISFKANTNPPPQSSSGIIATSGVLATAAVVASIVALTAAPDFTATQTESGPYKSTSNFSVTMSANPDLDTIYAISPDGSILIPKSDGNYIYSFTGKCNGMYTVVAKAVNGKEAECTLTITNVDNMHPTITKYTVSGNELTLTLTDDLSDIDYDSIYAELPDGSRFKPITCDVSTSTVVFESDTMQFYVYISDNAGNISRNAVSVE